MPESHRAELVLLMMERSSRIAISKRLLVVRDKQRRASSGKLDKACINEDGELVFEDYRVVL